LVEAVRASIAELEPWIVFRIYGSVYRAVEAGIRGPRPAPAQARPEPGEELAALGKRSTSERNEEDSY